MDKQERRGVSLLSERRQLKGPLIENLATCWKVISLIMKKQLLKITPVLVDAKFFN